MLEVENMDSKSRNIIKMYVINLKDVDWLNKKN